MNTTSSPRQDNSAAASIDLLPYINALIDARWKLVVAALVSGLLTGLWAYSQPYMYQSSVKVAVVDIEDPGGVSPDDRRASEVLTLVEHGFVMGTTRDNYNDVIMARLVSRDFTMRFLDEFNIYRLFYPEQWNKDEQVWVVGFTPDRGKSFTRFRDEMRSVEHDEETDIITVNINWVEAGVARDVANQYVSAFNEFIRNKTKREVQRKQEFLHEELRRSDIVDIRQSLYRLIEAQTAVAMLASAREEYALEIIDPAAAAYRSFNMSRKRKVLLGMIVGTMLAVFTVFGLILVRAMLQTVLAYREIQGWENSAQDKAIAFEKGDN